MTLAPCSCTVRWDLCVAPRANSTAWPTSTDTQPMSMKLGAGIRTEHLRQRPPAWISTRGGRRPGRSSGLLKLSKNPETIRDLPMPRNPVGTIELIHGGTRHPE